MAHSHQTEQYRINIMASPVPEFVPATSDDPALKFERGVACHVLGTLLAWAIALFVYLTYRLWQVKPGQSCIPSYGRKVHLARGSRLTRV